MELKHLFTADEENRAVSPVIGVILMVAITVILAAVIGTFVLGLGDQVQETSPNAQWDWEVQDDDSLDLTHEGGDSVNPARLSMSGPSAATVGSCGDGDWTPDEEEVTAGNACEGIVSDTTATSAEGEYRLTWTAEGGSSSSTLTTYEV